jgi:1,4-alpha-glucan branching enzyme
VQECSRQGLELLRLDDALERHEPAALGGGEDWEASSWGQHGDLSTWSGPPVAEMAFAARGAELELLAAGERVGDAAVRELLALQASDWAFMVSRGVAAPYARERFAGHQGALATALANGADASIEGARNLAVHADRASLLL